MDDPRSANKLAGGGEAPADAKLTIKAGDTEIHLEARPEIVREELDRLVDRLFPAARDPAAGDPLVVSVTPPKGGAPVPPTTATEPPATATAPPPAKKEGGNRPPAAALDAIAQARGRQMIQPGVEELLKHTTLDRERLAGLYAVDPRGRVILKKLPSTADQVRDTVLLLLYGALTMLGETSQDGLRLVRAVRSMGLRTERVPRELAAGGELAVSFGRHRGKRYRLTADGIRFCERLIPGLLRALRG